MKLLTEGLKRLCEDAEAAENILPRLDAVSATLDAYAGEIETFNPAYGLVKVKDRAEFVTRHLLDSLAPLGHIVRLLKSLPVPPGTGTVNIADAGSGAGLPGIPLAVCLPGVQFSLIERTGRRAGFLRNTAAVLGLENAVVEETALETAEPGRFDVVVFRALAPLEKKLAASLERLLAKDGFLAAYKGRRQTAEAELAALGKGEIIPLSVPFTDAERCLAVLRGQTAFRRINVIL